VAHRGGAADAADAGAGVHVELHFALEHQRAVDHGVRPDHHARDLVLAEVEAEIAFRLLDADATRDPRVGANSDVAVHGFDATFDGSADQADRAVDGTDIAAYPRAAVDEDAAVHRFQIAVDPPVAAETDGAVDGRHLASRHRIFGADAAVDGFHLFGAGAAGQLDAAVDRAEV